MWWGEDLKTLTYLTTDSSEVGEMSIPYYEDVDDSPYPSANTFRYPKAGTPNPTVTVNVYSLLAGASRSLTLPAPVEPIEYITGVSVRDGFTYVRTLNRMQTLEQLAVFSTATTDLVATFVTQKVTNGWIESSAMPISLPLTDDPATDPLLLIRNVSNFFHIQAIHPRTGALVATLSSGEYDVLSIDGIDPVNKYIYFTSTSFSAVTQSVGLINYTKLVGAKEPVTIDAFLPVASGDAVNSVSINTAGTAGVFTYLGPNLPQQHLCSLPLGDGNSCVPLVDNDAVEERLSKLQLPQKQFVSVSGVEDTLNAMILESVATTTLARPLLLAPYGGPNSRTVMKTWSLGINEYLSSQGIVVASVDNVGTGGRGLKFLMKTYLQLGTLEIADQVAAAQDLMKRRSLNIDKDKVGLWGWSFGGFMALQALEHNSHVFSTAVSVAPVSDWRLYDSVYTERYMQTPQLNPHGYNSTSTLSNSASMAGELLLVHGTGDDNVHFQNSVELDKHLIANGFQFETMFYANRQHSISSDNARPHLYHLITNFLKRTFQMPHD
eukprot:TRINITY_DN7766_c0_g1_i1.p1 TRINITY_DN7766_c0_g1~~TRINITY_DN7766_c0_g1_i1.p1  ORF type:complete len:550 (-),score=81.47 TRINITY_DN7766_c0_g1_i1:150-1799(-)